MTTLPQFQQLPILGILRGIKLEDVDAIAEAVVSSGLKTIEITMNTQNASALMRQMVNASDGRLTIGAGTVLTMDDLKAALDAGASFIVSPILQRNVVEYCVKHDVPVFPGAFTPQEIYDAWNAGASMVKVFPAKFLGPGYIKEIKGPLNNVKLLACGGINKDNIKEFFFSGASAVAFGGSVFRAEWIAEKKFSLIEETIKDLIAGLRIPEEESIDA
jgi:2-dehydro-3-deoxyphosphogluconate aldolase/(4S)-4-hydroxy-2-oxoglutarate aldolase